MIFKKSFLKPVALTLAFSFINQILFPVASFALTGGPSQPEVQSFTPAGVSEMVDPFTGDFNYNLPLFDLEGYPVNMSYQSGVTMDQEASWVGLGWNLNPGVVNRNVRGLPDDFNGEKVEKEYNMKPNITVGVSGAYGAEIAGYEGLSLKYGIGASYNNYSGIGFEQTAALSFSAANKGYGPNTKNLSLGLTSSQNGLTISPSYSLSNKGEDFNRFSASASFNSRTGLQSIGFKINPLNISSAGQTVNFGVKTHTPNISMSMVTTSVNASFKDGVTFYTAEGTANYSGYLTNQRLLKKNEAIPAYGYMYSENSEQDSAVLLDFNREKDQSFSENTPTLPVTNFTYDIFSVAGQGVGGTFRPSRSDIGYVYDNFGVNKSNSFSLGLEISKGNSIKWGGDFGLNLVSGHSGAWTDRNYAANILQFKKGGNDLYEPYYFKKVGELTAETEPQRFNDLGGNSPVRLKLESGGGLDHITTGSFVNGDEQESLIKSNVRTKRQRRNDVITVLTKSQADRFGLSYQSPNPSAQNHHIATVTSLRPDGSLYVYGIAAYNKHKEEVSFSVGSKLTPPVDCVNGLVNFTNAQASIENESGLDRYYNKVVTPPYAHSYLLTAVLSADYVDIDNIRGPSDGDLGQYKKFNYKKHSANYKWRVPVEGNKANYNEGLRSDHLDDKADFVYGEKELWYIETIESKNQIAVFHTSKRKDGYGVLNRYGGLNNSDDATMLKLDKISIYSKQDYIKNNANAIPIKEVHFEYNYSLCKGVPNNIDGSNFGKLTLLKVYFTYGKSYQGRANAYTFNYRQNQPDFNPGYNLKGYDRWGNYKPVDPTTCTSMPFVSNSEAPYVIQDKTLADKYSSAWHLSEIGLPSGGKIKVDYESDDYAFVQDQHAMQMFNIVRVSNTKTNAGVLPADNPVAAETDDLMEIKNLLDFDISPHGNNLYLHFKLQNPINVSSNAIDSFYKSYLKDITDLHFRCLVDMKKSGKDYEYVNGYAEIDKTSGEYGLNKLNSGSSEYNYGFIKLKAVPLGDRETVLNLQVNPIAKAAWQFGRQNVPHKVFDGTDRNDNGAVQAIKAIAASSFYKNIIETFQGPNRVIRNKDYGKRIYLNKSWIRLYNPTSCKYGGGSRVKKIVISDGWATMVNGQSEFEYGQEYTYKTIDQAGNLISSGVAANEPQVGGEENPLRKPLWSGDKEQRLLAPDDKFYIEEPLGESFYPSASVGYSEVKVKSLSHNNVTRHATGYVVNKFYTAKDFPTISKRTRLDVQPIESEPLLKVFSITHKNYITASQGFVVELNDMHGKAKSVEVYGQDQSNAPSDIIKRPISKKEYRYKSEVYRNGSFKLNNKANTINTDGSVSETDIGLDYDLIADMREQESKTFSSQIGFNLNIFYSFIPVPVPTAFPTISKENVRFRSAVMTKVINRSAILEEVIASDLGSKVSTKNLAYDAETGEVLLTQTTNNFNDPLYSFTYPAHWYYEGMGGAYKNIGLKKNIIVGSNGSNNIVTNGLVVLPNANKLFIEGDQLILEKSGSPSVHAWISFMEESGGSFVLINKAGNLIPDGNYTATVIVSGRKNLQSNKMGTLTSTVNPLSLVKNGLISNVLAADAIEYTDLAQTFCECFQNNNAFYTFKSNNPYVNGRKGIWKVKQSFTYLTDRLLTLNNNNTNIRHDGSFASFSPFWKYDGAKWTMNTTGWTAPSRVTMYSPYNVELENKDALDRPSAAVYGYNQSLPTAVAGNARYRDIAFDNFEDNDYPSCTDDHFSFKQYKNNVVETDAHSGKRSIKVFNGNNLNLSKQITPCNY